MNHTDLMTLGLSLGLGLLVGLQRENIESRVAGIRTFSLVTLMGTLCAFISRYFDNIWMIGFGLVGVAMLLVIANFLKRFEKRPDIGQTTEISVLLMYVLGAYLVFGDQTLGVVLGGVIAVLLYLKETLGKFIDRLGEKDMRAIFQFVAISLIVLPVLPNRFFGPYSVLNFREIWLMVVLITGLSIAGYFGFKWFGKEKGIITAGILGGMISSTATTMTYSHQAKESPSLGHMASFIIVAASTMAFLRVIVEIGIVTWSHFGQMAPPLIIMMVCMLAICRWMYRESAAEVAPIPEPENPAQFKTALVFALLYAIILLTIATVKDLFGSGGLYVVSLVSGLTDMDAVTLSLSNTVDAGGLDAGTGWRMILVAGLSNLAFKGSMAIFIGGVVLRRFIIRAFAPALVVGLLILFLWP